MKNNVNIQHLFPGILLLAGLLGMLVSFPSCSQKPYVYGEAGEDTFDLLARYDITLREHRNKQIILRVSLADEGLHELGERALLSYRENIDMLVRKLTADGREVSVMLSPMSPGFNRVDSMDVVEINEWLSNTYTIAE